MHVARLCERPGCSQVAEMTYGFDADHLMVWIDAYDRVPIDRAGVLCRRHADAMVVPLGWMLDDRRDPVPRLFRSPAQHTPTTPRHRRASAPQRHDVEQLQLGDDEVDVDDAVAVSEPAETDTDVQPWKPMFDQTDDLDGLLVARSPLLARAFGGRGRRRPTT
jgi:hypothetical protein